MEVPSDHRDDDCGCCEVGEKEDRSGCVVVGRGESGDERRQRSGSRRCDESVAGPGDEGDADTEERPDDGPEGKRCKWDLFAVNGEADICSLAHCGDEGGDDCGSAAGDNCVAEHGDDPA